VAIRNRQPGSSFKPYVYLTAFTKGFTPETLLWDVDTNFSTDDGKTYDPKNYDGKNRGPVEMKDALAMSLNVPAVETLYLAGVKNSVDTAHKMGITTLNQPDRYGLSLVLGGGEVTLLDHVNAYSTFATGGIHHDKVSILKVEDSKGNVLEEYKPSDGQRVVDEKYVSMIDYIMSTNDLRAPVFGANNPLNFTNRQVAAKTGTTNEWRDGWTMGFTPSLAVGVWAGNNDNSTMATGADGIYVAAPIFRSFMDKTLQNYSVEKFPEYKQQDTGKDVLDGKLKPTDEIKVCSIPGKKDKYCLATDACPDSRVEKKKFSNAHGILYYVNKDDPQGDQPKDPSQDPQYKNWEKAVEKWTKDNKDYSHDSPPTEDCSSKDFGSNGPSVKISSPSDGDTITSSSFTIKADVSSDVDIKKITIEVDGSEVYSGSKESYSYSVPDNKKSSSLNIKVTAEDEDGNDDSDSITVHTNIP
jgi:membrane peptidoglycan carboxypeptidase